MTKYIDKSTSLLERKKRQWAVEKDELEKLWAPWGNTDITNYNSHIGRDQELPKQSTVNNFNYRRDSSSDNSQRQNSLPPLNKYQNSSDKFERGGETSGYASDNPNASEYRPPPVWNNQNHHQSGYESSSSRDDRPRWRDKEISKEHFWDSKDHDRNFTQNEPPNWLKRGLEQNGHIEVTNSSPSESPEQGYVEHDRPLTSSSSIKSRSYIRGQNIHLDTAEIAERERKREIARQHQEEVRKQLEERERKRSEERKRRIQEEYEEELRIAREQEVEKRRQEHEQKLLREKQQKEEKRKEAIREAIEIAEKEAKLQKMKLKLMKQQNNNAAWNNEPLKTNSDSNNNYNESNVINNNEKSNLTPRDSNLNNRLNNFAKEEDKEVEKELINSGIATDTQNNNICIKNNLNTPSTSKEVTQTSTEKRDNCSQNTKSEPLAIVLPSNFDTLQHFQYAVLMPIPSSSSIPVAIPLSIPSDKNQYTASTSRVENRILTPTQYRQKNKLMCDNSTQTDDYRIDKISREKNTSMEINYDSRSRKGRSSSRNENVTDRPKWGANRPPTRYMKQSEKDPLYQRKKMRQRNQEHFFDDKNSSDDSQMGTPRYRKKTYLEKRQPRSLWRKHDQEVFTRHIRMYQSEIIPIEADKDNVCYEHKCCCTCKCSGKVETNGKVDILKIEPQSPGKVKKLPKSINNNTPENRDLIVETLPSLRSDMLKQEQWNSPRTPSLTPKGNNF